MSKTVHTLNPEAADWLAATFARNRAIFGGWRMEATGGDGAGGDGDPQTFTQADVDRIVADRLKREREATKAKYADYDDLRAKAEGAKTAEERIANLENELGAQRLAASRAQIVAEFGLTEKQAAALKYAPSEEAARELAEGLAAESAERKRKNNVSPREGNTPQSGSDPMREFTRGLFARAAADE